MRIGFLRIGAVLSLFAVAGGCAGSTPCVFKSPRELYDHVDFVAAIAVQKIKKSKNRVCADTKPSISVVNGFVVDLNGKKYIVTVGHIQGINEKILKIKAFLARDQRLYDVAVEALNSRRDLALLSFCNSSPSVAGAVFAEAQKGEEVVAIGGMSGIPFPALAYSVGKVDEIFTKNNQTFIAHTAFSLHGSSGGPILNLRGQVVGITSKGEWDEKVEDVYGQLAKRIIAVPSAEIKQWLSRLGFSIN